MEKKKKKRGEMRTVNVHRTRQLSWCCSIATLTLPPFSFCVSILESYHVFACLQNVIVPFLLNDSSDCAFFSSEVFWLFCLELHETSFQVVHSFLASSHVLHQVQWKGFLSSFSSSSSSSLSHLSFSLENNSGKLSNEKRVSFLRYSNEKRVGG